jgi:hypothetical protein
MARPGPDELWPHSVGPAMVVTLVLLAVVTFARLLEDFGDLDGEQGLLCVRGISGRSLSGLDNRLRRRA